MSTLAKYEPSTAVAITDEQTSFTSAQIAALVQLGVEDAPQGDLDVFFHQAKRTGLDPFAKQIYMLGRPTKTGGYRGEPEKWITKYTIQTGIDGYRLIAKRAARADGVKLRPAIIEWCGEDGVWRDVWLNANRPPVAAKATIYIDGDPVSATALYSEYVQTKRDGTPNSMWKSMPANQLGKCSEAAAIRRAFPVDTSGIVLEDAAHVVIDAEVVEPVKVDQRGGGLAGLQKAMSSRPRATSAGIPAAVDTVATVDAVTEPVPEVPKPTKAQLTALHALIKEFGLSTREDMLNYLEQTYGRVFTSSTELTRAEASSLIDYLKTTLEVDAAADTDPAEAAELVSPDESEA